jgi:UDP-GlcNAc:undecaprenyl-phosphate GlcNAc-1-phosphate transferase
VDAATTLIPLLVASGVAAVATPLVARLALRLGVVDRPSERSVAHRPGIPLLGGLAVAAGFAVGLAVGLRIFGHPVGDGHVGGLLLGGALILALGAWDDRFGLGAWPKFAGQSAAAAVAIAAGYQIGHVTDPYSREAYMLPAWLGWIVTLVWIVGVTNAINLVDGLDGLATGVAAIICATLTVIAWQSSLPLGVCIGVALLGGLLGFLPHNFPPARIFLGDTGSLFIGYTLAVLALEGYRQLALLPFVVPVLALAVPILDTGLSIVRRMWLRAPVFSADRMHLHHRLLATRGSTRSAVLQFYFVTGCFCLIALSFTRLQGYVAAACLLAVAVLTLRMLRNLGVLSFAAEDLPARGGAEEEKS